MAYEVLARKWRPQKFEDMVGQDHVVQTLQNAITTDRIAHAYLFVGPRGIGKTSVARIFAKALNCETGPTVSPCGTCDPCKEITAGTSMDVLEIDGASNNGVEQVRDLRETVKYAPTRGQFKIYIIDEVHMLSPAAFNALLKTLEEPPPHVKFVFATTEPEKILATIVSRCQRFDLRRIPVGLIIERLKVISSDEGVAIDDDALLAIARGSEGGLRDAESALDQLISFKGKTIVEQDVLSVFGLVSRETLEDLAGKVLSGDIKGVIGVVGELDAAGKDLQRLVLELMEHFRNLLVCMHTEDAGTSLDLTPSQVDVLKQQGSQTDTARVLRITTILTDVESRMRYALSRRTLLETALIRCARAAVVVSLEEILKEINRLRAGGASIKKKVAETPAAQPVSAPAPVVSVPPAPTPPSPAPAVVREAPPNLGLDALVERWAEVVERVGKVAPLARSALVDARPVSVQHDDVVIAFDPEFAQELESFKSGRNRKAVERTLRMILRREVGVVFTVADPGDSEEAPEPGPVPPAEKEEIPESSAETSGDPKKSLRDWADEPTVAKVVDMFDGMVVDVRE